MKKDYGEEIFSETHMMEDSCENKYPYSYQRGDATRPEPMPKGDGELVWEEVIKDMRSRDDFGEFKYSTRLKTQNGRDPLVDAYQEALDLAVYLKQCIMERDGK